MSVSALQILRDGTALVKAEFKLIQEGGHMGVREVLFFKYVFYITG
jgi:hypothetical protein